MKKTIKIICSENELNQHTYICEFENSCVVIDAGCSVNKIKQISSKSIRAVFVTHGHFDHIKLIEEYDKLNIPIYASKYINEMLNDEIKNASVLFGKSCKFIIKNLKTIESNEEIAIEDHIIKCLHTKGHSIDSMSFLIDNEALFSGDTLFANAVGRSDLPTGNTKQLIESLKQLLNLNYKALYAGHGRPSVKEEQNLNIPKWIDYLNKGE